MPPRRKRAERTVSHPRPARPYRQPRSRSLPAIVAAAAGLVTLASVFMPWYRTNLGEPAAVGTANGWDATSIGKALVALSVIWLLAALLAASDDFGSVRLAVATIEGLGYLVALCGLLGGALVAYRIARPPGSTPDFLSRDIGLAVAALGCVAGIVAGAAMAARR